MKKPKLLFCCLICFFGIIVPEAGMVAEDGSDSEELVLPGLELDEGAGIIPDMAPPNKATPNTASVASPVLLPLSPSPKDEDSEEVVLPGLEEMETETKDNAETKENEALEADPSEKSAFEPEEELPKDGEEWENWDGWDKIKSGNTSKADSADSVPEPAREAAMEESDKITDQSEETTEESVPEFDDQLDVSAHRMELTGEDLHDKPNPQAKPELSVELPNWENEPNEKQQPRLPEPEAGTDSDSDSYSMPESETEKESGAESGTESDSESLPGIVAESAGDNVPSAERNAVEEPDFPSKRQAELLLDTMSETTEAEAPFTEEDDFAYPEEENETATTLPIFEMTKPSAEKKQDSKVLILTEELKSLLERVAETRNDYWERPVQTDTNSPYEAIMAIWAFGCQANVRYMPDGVNFNAVAALCWNYPIGELPTLGWRNLLSSELGAERSILITAPGNQTQIKLAPVRVFPMTGYCQQERPGDLLAALAMGLVPASYQFKLDGRDCSVADLIETESLLCIGGDMSAQLVALSYYRARDTWKNQFRQTVNVRKILEHELRRTAHRGSCEATERLFGITFALRRRLAFREIPLEKSYVKADEYLKRFSGFVLDQQNSDGSWHGQYFLRKGKSIDPDADFAATGNIARWLLLTIPNDRLDDPKIIAAIEFLTTELQNRTKRYNPAEQSQALTKGYAYALQTIGIFQQRWGGSEE